MINGDSGIIPSLCGCGVGTIICLTQIKHLTNIVAESERVELTIKERFTVSSSELVSKVKQLVREGNIRRVRLIHKKRTLLDIPISVGAPAAAVGIVVAPLLAAVAAIAAMVTECTIEVERAENKKGQ